MKITYNHQLIIEKPEHYSHKTVQDYMQNEISRGSKRWIYNIINGLQETEHIKENNEHFVILPDTERINSYLSTREKRKPQRQPSASNMGESAKSSYAMSVLSKSSSKGKQLSRPKESVTDMQLSNKDTATTLNWLAILKNPSLRTLRDLDASHIPVLEKLRDSCIRVIQAETDINTDEIMMYVHYHPSVYQLHVHIAFPYMQYNHRDVYRIHSIETIINNLRMDGDYYRKAHLQISVHKDSVLYHVIKNADTIESCH